MMARPDGGRARGGGRGRGTRGGSSFTASAGQQGRDSGATFSSNDRPRGRGDGGLRQQSHITQQTRGSPFNARAATRANPFERSGGNMPRGRGGRQQQQQSVPTSNQSSIDSDYAKIPKTDFESRYKYMLAARPLQIQKYVAQGKMNDPDPEVKYHLADAIKLKGECRDMCPEFERLRRIQENDVLVAEFDPSTLGGRRQDRVPDENRMVKKFRRSAAGIESQSPMDIRDGPTLLKTMHYLIKLTDEYDFPKIANFIWDRTRAVRNDFSIQDPTRPDDIRLALDCYLLVARYHLLSMQQMSNPSNDVPESYSHHQDVEQFKNTLQSAQSLLESGKVVFPHEAELRAYKLMYDLLCEDPYAEYRAYKVPARVRNQTIYKVALRMFEVGSTAKSMQGPMKPEFERKIALQDIQEFFDLVRSPQTPYLLACAAQMNFNKLRHAFIKSMVKSYKQRRQTVRDWTVEDLQHTLMFDFKEEAEEFLSHYGLPVGQRPDGVFFVNFSAAAIDPEAFGRTHRELPPKNFSTVIEAKRQYLAFSDILKNPPKPIVPVNKPEEESLFISQNKPSSESISKPASVFAASNPFASTSSNPFASTSSNPFAPAPAVPQKPAALPPSNPFASIAVPVSQQTSTLPNSNPFATGISSAPIPSASIVAPSPFAPQQPPTSRTPSPFAGGISGTSFGQPTTFFNADSKPATSFAPPASTASSATATRTSPFTSGFTASPVGDRPIQPGVFDASKGPIKFAAGLPAFGAPASPAVPSASGSSTAPGSESAPPAALSAPAMLNPAAKPFAPPAPFHFLAPSAASTQEAIGPTPPLKEAPPFADTSNQVASAEPAPGAAPTSKFAFAPASANTASPAFTTPSTQKKPLGNILTPPAPVFPTTTNTAPSSSSQQQQQQQQPKWSFAAPKATSQGTEGNVQLLSVSAQVTETPRPFLFTAAAPATDEITPVAPHVAPAAPASSAAPLPPSATTTQTPLASQPQAAQTVAPQAPLDPPSSVSAPRPQGGLGSTPAAPAGFASASPPKRRDASPPPRQKTAAEIAQERSQGYDELAMNILTSGMIEEFVKFAVEGMYPAAKEQVRHEAQERVAADFRKFKLSVKYLALWREKAYRRRLRRHGRERREQLRRGDLGSSVFGPPQTAPSLAVAPPLPAAEMTQVVPTSMGSIATAGATAWNDSNKNNNNKRAAPAGPARDTPRSEKRSKTTTTATAASITPSAMALDAFGRPLEQFDSPGPSSRPSSNPTRGRVEKAKASRVKSNPMAPPAATPPAPRSASDGMRRSLLGSLFNDTSRPINATETDYFRLRAIGIEPPEPGARGRKRISETPPEDNELPMTVQKRPRVASVAPRDFNRPASAASSHQSTLVNAFRTSTLQPPKDDDERLARWQAFKNAGGQSKLNSSFGKGSISPPVLASARRYSPPALQPAKPAKPAEPAYMKRDSRFLPRELYGKGPEAVRQWVEARRASFGSTDGTRSLGPSFRYVSGSSVSASLSPQSGTVAIPAALSSPIPTQFSYVQPPADQEYSDDADEEGEGECEEDMYEDGVEEEEELEEDEEEEYDEEYDEGGGIDEDMSDEYEEQGEQQCAQETEKTGGHSWEEAIELSD